MALYSSNVTSTLWILKKFWGKGGKGGKGGEGGDQNRVERGCVVWVDSFPNFNGLIEFQEF